MKQFPEGAMYPKLTEAVFFRTAPLAHERYDSTHACQIVKQFLEGAMYPNLTEAAVIRTAPLAHDRPLRQSHWDCLFLLEPIPGEGVRAPA